MRHLILVLAVLSLTFFSFVSVEGRVVDEASDSKLINFIYGDANGDGEINLADAVYLVNYLFIWGPEPIPYLAGDCNCDQMVNLADAVYLVNYLFINGPVPGCPPQGWIDGTVYNSETDEPLEGAIIKIDVLSDSVFSDTAGQFFFEVPSGQEFVLTITKPGFTYAQRKATAPEERDVAVDPVYLKPLDTLVTHITPAGGTAVDSRGHIELIFPPGAVPYDIDVIATQCDKGKELPTPLPEQSVFTYALELEPHGVVFNDSVTMRIANTLGFEPGTPIPIGFYNTATAQWEDVGMGYVTPDGEWSEYKIKRFSWYDCNLSIWWLQPDSPPQIECNFTSDQNKEIDQECGHSAIGRKTGTLWISHTLPQFRTMGVSQAPRFVYNSSTTHPNPILETYTSVDMSQSLPYSALWRVEIEGHQSFTHFVGGYGNSRQAILSSSLNFRGDTLETGSYAYTLEIGSCYYREYARTWCFGCPAETTTNIPVPFPVCRWTAVTRGYVVINNRLEGPFGVGWSLAELQKLHFNPDGSITLEEGDGTLLTYTAEGLGSYLPPEGEYSQLNENEDGSFTRKFRDGTEVNFDTSGFMTSVVDRNQNTTNYNYNEDDLLVSIVSPVGQITQLVYDDSNYLDKVIDPAGRVTDFTIDSEGNVVEIMDPDSSITHYGYSDHSLTRLINPKGDTTKYSYDEFYRLSEVEQPAGACCKSGYYHLTPTDVQGLINSLPDTLGTEENPAPRVNPDTIWSVSVDGKGNITKVKTDKFGGILERRDPLGYTTVFERDSNSNITQITKPNNAVTSMTYDSLGNLLTYVSPIRLDTTRYTYEPNFNQVTSITDPKVNITYIEYDSLGNAIRIIDALNDTTQMEYNTRGQLTKIINALGDSSVFKYGSLGNLEVAINPLGDSVVLAYNLAGDVDSSTDALGRVTQYEYDIMGRLVEETNADSNITQYEYDEKGNLTKVIDAKLHETQFFYDRRDQLVRTINPLGDSTIYEYDINGNLILSINPNSDSIHYEYDPLDRLIKKLLPDDTTSFAYSSVGNMVRINDKDSRVMFDYDPSDRVTSARGPLAPYTPAMLPFKVAYAYDLNGNVRSAKGWLGEWGEGDFIFASAVSCDVEGAAQSVFCADLDGDLNLDLAVAGGGGVYIVKNNGDGTFQSAVNYEIGGYGSSIFCGDLDRDLDLDLAVASYYPPHVSILKNNGDGTFQSAVNYGAGQNPWSVFCADLDGDSALDLAVASYSSDSLSILKNNGDGTFQTAVNYGAGDWPYSIFCADLDGDTDLDLAVANEWSYNVSILKNNGDGTFQSAVNYETGAHPISVFCADLDGDSALDLAVANYWGRNISILKNKGNGTFQSAVNYAAGVHPYSVFCADLDGDTDLDLAVADEGSDNVSILKNNGNGTFQSAVYYYASGSYPRSVFCADLDGDLDLDLAVANESSNNVSILKNNGDGTFGSTVNYGTARGPTSTFCADLDGDTDLDLAVSGDHISILKNNGDGTFDSAVIYQQRHVSLCIFCADLDGDSALDLAVANSTSDSVSILKNNGNGTFQSAVSYGVGQNPWSVFCADLDGDSALDLAVANYSSDSVSILKNNGNGTFQSAVNYRAGNGPTSISCADLDGDTDLDLAVANGLSDNVSIIENNGDGTFQSTVNYLAGDRPRSVFCADLDGDLDLDLAVANEYTDNVSILKNNGDGTFQTEVDYGAGDGAYSVFCADLDGDTHLDLAVANENGHNVSILKNNGDGTFQGVVNYGPGQSPMSVFCADLDGDTDLDLAVANNISATVSIIMNKASERKGTVVSYEYDELNRLTSVVADDSDTTLFAYDKLSRRTLKQYANGVVAEYGYDQASQLLSLVNRLNADTISKYNYVYDPVGNRIKMIEEAGVDSFTYDVLYRLTGAIHPQPSNPEENFDYDGVGNRTFSHISTNYTYDSANRLLEDDQYEYRYDKNGNLVWKKTKAKTPRRMRGSPIGQRPDVMEKTPGDSVVYSWNAENTLLGFVEYHLGDTSKVVSYKYDGLGRRIEKKVDTLVTKYVYDNEDIIFEIDGNDSIVAIYTHGPGIDEPISVQRDSAKYYYHQDGLGSITYITDTLGNIINTYLYDSFGNIKERTGGLENSYTYTGREWDEESGMYHFRARYYNPSTGQFIAEDPIGFLGGKNFYGYCENNPIIFLDPFGAKKFNWGRFGACSADNAVQTAASFIPGVSVLTNYVEFQGYQKAFGYEQEFVKFADTDIAIGGFLRDLGEHTAKLAYQSTLNAARNNAVTSVMNGMKEVHRLRPPGEFRTITSLRRATSFLKGLGTVVSLVDFGIGMIDCYKKSQECP